MTTGEYIRRLRTGENKFGKTWSQEEIGKMLNPPVNRAAINKWETGTVTNIRKYYIEQLASIFGVTPTALMCFDSKYDTSKISEELQVIEAVRKTFGRKSVKLLKYFTQLNDLGKEKVLDDLIDMIELPRYAE